MKTHVRGILTALVLGCALATTAGAQQRPTVAVIPTQYFSADERSADHVTQALVEEFQRRGYTVISADRAQSTFQEMGWERNRDIGDTQLRQFGRRLDADLVVHPQLMAVGIPAARDSALASVSPPSAVLYLRVLNARTGKGIYTRQIGYDFQSERPLEGEFTLPPQVASATVEEAARSYFERVAGSRQEFRRGR